MKKFLFILLLIPVIGFGQTNADVDCAPSRYAITDHPYLSTSEAAVFYLCGEILFGDSGSGSGGAIVFEWADSIPSPLFVSTVNPPTTTPSFRRITRDDLDTAHFYISNPDLVWIKQ